ncbi:unnamed protein product, partial [Rotaria magnacalcarata]
MSDVSKSTRKHKRRDRSKTNSGVLPVRIPNCNKRPLDEIHSCNSSRVKRRALSATTVGSENQACSIMFFNDREDFKEITTSEYFCDKPKPATKFETSLPNEILFEIFKYLSQSDVFYAFLNLNQRFNQLLQPFTYHIDCSKLSIKQFEHIRNHLGNAKSLTLNNQ